MDQPLIEQLKKLKAVAPRPEWKREQREILYKQISGSISGAGTETETTPKHNLTFAWFRHTTQPALAVFIIAVILVGGTMTSAKVFHNAKPGDIFYAAKLFNEKTLYTLTFNEERKAELGLQFAGNRARELKEVLATPDPREEKEARVRELVSNFKKELDNAKTRIARINARNDRPAEPIGRDLPETTPENLDEPAAESGGEAAPAEAGEGLMFSANLGKDDNGIEVGEGNEEEPAGAETAETAEETTGPDQGEEQTAAATSSSAAEAASSSPASLSDPEEMITEAQTLFDQQDYDATLDKLNEAGEMIDRVGQGEVKGEEDSIENIDETEGNEDGEVLGVDEVVGDEVVGDEGASSTEEK